MRYRLLLYINHFFLSHVYHTVVDDSSFRLDIRLVSTCYIVDENSIGNRLRERNVCVTLSISGEVQRSARFEFVIVASVQDTRSDFQMSPVVEGVALPRT